MAAQIIFRTGGSRHIGFGHVRRCLSLAEALRRLGTECVFLLDGDPVIFERVAALRFEAIPIESADDLAETVDLSQRYQAKAIVVDSYAISREYLCGLADKGIMVAVMDDLAERELPVDLVINGSIGAEQFTYRGAGHTLYLLGAQYILLRPGFAEAPRRKIPERVRRVLITVGGSDPHDLTARLMCWTLEILAPIALDVVIGPLFENGKLLERDAQRWPGVITLHHDPPDMRDVMLAADLALCGGGQTIYELAAIGTPAVAIQLAENQAENLRGLAAAGALAWVGSIENAGLEARVKGTLEALVTNPAERATMSRRGRALVDGQGAFRVARVLWELMRRHAT